MDDAALALLENPEARLMVAAWSPQISEQGGLRMMMAWSESSGVSRPTVQHLAHSLIRAGIVLPGGQVSVNARKFLVASAVKTRKKR